MTDAERAYEQHIANCAECYDRGAEKGWCAQGIELFTAARGGHVVPEKQFLCSGCGREMDGPGVCSLCRQSEQRELEQMYDLSAVRGHGDPGARRRKESAQL